MMHKILVIDDAEEVILAVESALSASTIHVDSALTVKDAMKKASSQLYHLILIDIMLPDGDGFDLLLKMRKIEGYQSVPMIFITSKEDVSSVVSAFSLGAEDYIVKPFRLLELKARVERRLNKESKTVTGENSEVVAGELVINTSAQRVKVHGKNENIQLTSREFKILLLLAKNPDHVFSRKQILERVWGANINVTNRTVDAHICYLRKKLDRFSTYIESVSGEGYRFNPNAS
jgi:DNA-binding response OmpR family regulator